MKYNIIVEPTENNREWRVIVGFSSRGLTVPTNSIFDGASIPLGLRFLFPHGGKKFAPAAMHDYLYRTGVIHKRRADKIFYDLMMENGVEPWKAKAMYWGVKYCGGPSWRKRRKESK
jgi:hypothetical protein